MQERRFGSRYVLTELLGRGAMGRVYRARVEGQDGEVAVKLLRDDLTADAGLVSRFLQEGRLLKSVRQVNVVRIIDLVAEGDDLGIVMDLVPAGDLRRAVPAPCPVQDAVRIAADIADGLSAVHAAGITHRDLKPENVLMAQEPDGTLRPCITDFGISRFADASVSRATGLMGTPGYLAPEVAHGGTASPAADVYALGVILYELCSGRAPFVAENPMALIRAHAEDAVPRLTGLPDAVREVLAGMLAKEPAERPTAGVAGQALRRALAGGTLDARTIVRVEVEDPVAQAETIHRLGTVPPLAPSTSPGPAGGRRRLRIGLAAAAALGAIAVLVPMLVRDGGHQPAIALTTDAASSTSTSPTTTGAPQTSTSRAPAPSTTSATGTTGTATSAGTHVAPRTIAVAPVTVVVQGTAAAAPRSTAPKVTVAKAVPVTAAKPKPVSASSLVSVGLGHNARLYFGQLSALMGSVGGVTFRTDSGYRQAHPTQCASTVVVRGVSGTSGAVFASGLGAGWGGAEAAPDQSVSADGGTLHQQIIVPPGSAAPGQSWTLQSSMTVDGTGTYLGRAALAVSREDSAGLVWTVGGAAVRCSPA